MTPEGLSFTIPLPQEQQADPIEVLRAAREYGAKEGISTGILCDSRGHACALGIIGIVRWGIEYVVPNSDRVYGRLEEDPAVDLVFRAIMADDEFAEKARRVYATESHEGDTEKCEVVISMNDSWAGPSARQRAEEHRERVLGIYDKAIELGEADRGNNA